VVKKSEEPKPKVNGINGVAGVLAELAKSGDNWVKLVIVGGLFWNTVVTTNNNKGISTNEKSIQLNNHEIATNSAEIGVNSKELVRFRTIAAKQLKVVFDNQRVFADFMDEIRASQDRIQTKLDIPHPQYQPYPRQEVPDYTVPDTNGNKP